eukprot:scaffold6174_cov125-Isochrysis_galbana.AAC.23
MAGGHGQEHKKAKGHMTTYLGIRKPSLSVCPHRLQHVRDVCECPLPRVHAPFALKDVRMSRWQQR